MFQPQLARPPHTRSNTGKSVKSDACTSTPGRLLPLLLAGFPRGAFHIQTPRARDLAPRAANQFSRSKAPVIEPPVTAKPNRANGFHWHISGSQTGRGKSLTTMISATGRGFGILVPVFFFGSLWEAQSLANGRFGSGYAYTHLWVAGAAALCAAAMCAAAAVLLRSGRASGDRPAHGSGGCLEIAHLSAHPHALVGRHICRRRPGPVDLQFSRLEAARERPQRPERRRCRARYPAGTAGAPGAQNPAKPPGSTISQFAAAQPEGTLGGNGVTNAPFAEAKLVRVTRVGPDIHASLQVRQEWIDAERRIAVTLPGGRSVQIHLTHAMANGVNLRMKGQVQPGNGDLYLQLEVLN